MLMQKLRRILTGYLIVSVQGESTEKFLNMAAGLGIVLRHVVKKADKAVFLVNAGSYSDLRLPAKKTGCRLQILERRGLPFAWRKLKRRGGLLLGFCLFVVTLYALSSFIFFINVQGNERLSDDYILRLAHRAGVRPGLHKSRLDIDDLAARMQLMDAGIAWVGLSVRGTRLIIEIAETDPPPAGAYARADLVASKDGLVADVVVITGEAMVRAGDTVRRGQVLIRGIAPQLDNEDGQRQPVPLQARARGQVLARVWYEGYGEASQNELERVRTGRFVRSWTLYADGQPVARWGRTEAAFTDSERYTAARGILERILPLRVELKTYIIYEVEKRNIRLTKEQARDLAAGRAGTLARLQLPAGQRVEKALVEEIDLSRPGFVGARYVLETIENIAVEKEITGGD